MTPNYAESVVAVPIILPPAVVETSLTEAQTPIAGSATVTEDGFLSFQVKAAHSARKGLSKYPLYPISLQFLLQISIPAFQSPGFKIKFLPLPMTSLG